jgi:hypothetical protein
MDEQERIQEYNYSTFEGKEDFLAFRRIAQVGTAAPDFVVTDARTGRRHLLSERWRNRDLLIEFGSLT